jgi:phosphoglycerate dehydrogenase-like enzyme
MPKGSPLLGLSNVIINAHIASTSVKSSFRQRTSVANTMACAVRGDKLPNVVNGVR